jgi:hypothetical protein
LRNGIGHYGFGIVNRPNQAGKILEVIVDFEVLEEY